MNVGVGRLHSMAVHVDNDLSELIELVDDQLLLSPAGRLELLLGGHWPRCEQGIRTVAAVGDQAVLVGPVAVALHGGPQQPGDGRVDLLCASDAQDDVAYALLDAGARVGQSWRAGPDLRGETRMHFTVNGGEATLRTRATGIDDVAGVVARGKFVHVAGAGVRVAGLQDLIAISFASPWGQDGPYRSGLRALRAHRALHGASAA